MSQPLAQSADKKELVRRLGLTEDVHRKLLDEAQQARDTLSWSEQNLTDQSRLDPSVRKPYKWDELSETAKHRGTLEVVNGAGPVTRPYYELGRYRTSVNEENWVARWYLWHSFRYRDNRDPRGRAAANERARGQGENQPAQNGGAYWDPVHNTWR